MDTKQPAKLNIKQQLSTLSEAIEKTSPKAYYILFALFIASFHMRRIGWAEWLTGPVTNAWMVVYSAVLWGAAIYLFFVIVNWKHLMQNTIAMLIIIAVLAAITALLANNLVINMYNIVMDCFFCLFAYKKKFRSILKCYLIVSLATLIVAAAGLPFGITRDLVKPDNVSPGHSFGIVYPNDWGHNAFLVMMVVWYLYLKKRPVITFAFFWAMTAFMYFIISCRTIALITGVFPFLALLVGWYSQISKDKKRHTILGVIFIALPMICYAVSYLLAWKFEYVHGLFYGTPLRTMAMRFVQGGIAMRYFGFPFIGITEMRIDGKVYALLNDSKVYLTVMDNAYISYTILRGVLWIIMCMGWLEFANGKAWKRRDYHLMLLSIILCGFAMMEWAGLNAWYNIMLMYPLALNGEADSPHSEHVYDFSDEDPDIAIQLEAEAKGLNTDTGNAGKASDAAAAEAGNGGTNGD